MSIPTAGAPFVGRERELAELRIGLEGSLDGRGGLFLFSGDPGIGKSRLADEFAAYAEQRGARVLWGRCWEGGGAPAYWPWLQVIRALAPEHSEALAHLGADGAYLAQLFPDLRDRLPGAARVMLDAEPSRFALFDTVARFLKGVSAERPLVLVFDDLHAADAPSLVLLRYLASDLRAASMIIVGTYREVEATLAPPIASLLGEILREGSRLPLVGLEAEDTGRFIELFSGALPDPRLVEAVHRMTEGNPFFLIETARLLIAEGSLAPSAVRRLRLPETLREAVRRRLGRLPDDVREVLAEASVSGRDFSVDVLEMIASRQSDSLASALETARRAGIVTELPGSKGRYSFSHFLIRETLYEDLTLSRRVDLHRLTGEALERLHTRNLEPHLPALACHFVEAATRGDGRKAVDYARKAAERAVALLAYEEAARLFEMAIHALESDELPDETRRCHLLISLGDAQRRAGESVAAMETCHRAARVARNLGAPDILARAALLLARVSWEDGTRADPVVALLEEALAAMKAEDSTLRAQLLARLARALAVRDAWRSPERRVALCREAIEMGRRVGDPMTLAIALQVRLDSLWDLQNVEERLAIATEFLEWATKAGDGELLARGHYYRWFTLLVRGDVSAVDAEIEVHWQLTSRLCQPLLLSYTILGRAARMIFDGRFEEGERLALESREIGRRAHSRLLDLHLEHLFLALRAEQGRLGETEPTLRQAVERHAKDRGRRAALAWVLCELGREAEARVEFERLAAQDFDDLPEDMFAFITAKHLSDVCASLGDRRRAARLYDLFAPYADLNVSLTGGVSFGSASLLLGRLAVTASRWDDAARHFERALEVNTKMGAIPSLAHTRYEYARMLLARGDTGDRENASELVASALETAQVLGMKALERRLFEVGELPAKPACEPSLFRKDGEFWTITFADSTVRLRDIKGLGYLASLLARPGADIHAAELAGLGGNGTLGDAGEALDRRARDDYRRRVNELRSEVEEAARCNDSPRGARAQAEIEALAHELSAAFGIGGRARRVASGAERARLMVTQRIKSAIGRISKSNPALGRHLAKSVRTGIFCRYESSGAVSWTIC